MSYLRKRKIVLLGMMTRMPVAGVVWQTIHYLVGFQRLGYDVYYVEAHAMNPSMFMEREEDDGSANAAAFINSVMDRFGFSGNWAFHALHEDDKYYGMGEQELNTLYDSAELIINLHGGTVPRPEFSKSGRLVYVETDPVQLQIELYNGVQETIDFLEPHCAFFTFGEKYGRSDCLLPVSEQFDFKTTRQPVVLDFWESNGTAGHAFTTIGNWNQRSREVVFQGEKFYWSKHYEFLKIIDLPARTDRVFELAMSSSSHAASDKQMLEDNGWVVCDALTFSKDVDNYQKYIQNSYGEFTVAKDQNVRLRTGWFSDRSATYLASERPVITQETGFSDVLPTGEGLFGFSDMDEILSAVESIESDHARHSKAAREIAREYFSYDVVLPRLLSEVGLTASV